MSRYHKEQIECPHCHHKGEFDLWESVNVDLDPEFRRQILSDRWKSHTNLTHPGKYFRPSKTIYY